MKSPISVLWGNIIRTFEQAEPSLLEMHYKATQSGDVSPAIACDDRKEKVKTPFANPITREIYLQETYLSHLWSFIYSVLVMYEEGVHKPMKEGTYNNKIIFNTSLLIRARQLFEWSISLVDTYSDWDESLPNPRSHQDSEEKFYAEKVNGVFQDSVAFLMFHEFAHLSNGHDSYFLGVKSIDLDESAIAERIQIENEADIFAFDIFIKHGADNTEKWTKGLAMLFVICSALVIVPVSKGLTQTVHMDLDDRILHLLQRLNLETNESEYYCWYLAGWMLSLYLQKHHIPIEPITHGTAQDLFYYYLDLLDKFKST